MLVSYVYYKAFEAERAEYHFRDYIMDSGAFSAYKSGYAIDLDEYIRFCKERVENDKALKEVTALDVIGDDRGSLDNANAMRDAGLDVIPVFHIGDDWGILEEYCSGYNKVGLSCRFGEPVKESYRFLNRCFAKRWPHKFHSFGWVDEKMLMRFPFHSSDTASWTNGPNVYGHWKSFGGKMSVYGSKHTVLAEVQYYLNIEEKLQFKWKDEMAKIDPFPVTSSPSVRLAYSICTVARNTLKVTGGQNGRGV